VKRIAYSGQRLIDSAIKSEFRNPKQYRLCLRYDLPLRFPQSGAAGRCRQMFKLPNAQNKTPRKTIPDDECPNGN